MATPTLLGIPELIEIVLSHLPTHEIIRAQRVCQEWRYLIETSPLLQDACWFTPRGCLPSDTKNVKRDAYTINPYFARLNMELGTRQPHRLSPTLPPDTDEHQSCSVDLEKLIYETPGSWCGMLAFQPPARYCKIECQGDYCIDENMFYHIESMRPGKGLRMGDVVAALAEMQNRQARGVDRWAGVVHIGLDFWAETYEDEDEVAVTSGEDNMFDMLRSLPDDVTVKVVVDQAWDAGLFPAFSLRRMHPEQGSVINSRHGADWKYELIMHEMEWDGVVYKWDDADEYDLRPMYPESEKSYQAKMLRVREHAPGYLQACRQVHQLIET